MRQSLLKTVVVFGILVLFATGIASAKSVLEVVVTDIPSGWTAKGQEAYNKVKADFEKINPDVEVKLMFRAWGTAYTEYLITNAAAGTLPDVFQIGGNHQGPLGRAGILMPLDEYIKRWGQWEDFPPGIRDDVVVGGRILGLPYRADVRLLMYNKRDFDEAALNREAPPKTWDEIISLGKKLTVRDGNQIQRAGFRWYGSEYYSPVWQAGGDFITEVNGKPQVAIDSNASREGLQFIDNLINEHQVLSTAAKSPKGQAWGMEFGNASIEYRAEGHIGKIREAGVDLGVGPAIKNKQAAELVFINKWAMGSQTKQPVQAWKWIEYVSQSKVVSEIQYNTAGLPPRRSVARLDPWASDPAYRAVYDVMAYVRPLPGSKYTNAVDIRNAFIAVLKGVTAGSAPVSTLVEQAKQAVAGYLANE